MKKFQLMQQFKGDTFALSDKSLFEKPKTDKQWNIRIPQVQNPFLNNELRAYLQDSIIERHMSPNSAQKLANNLCHIESLLNNAKYLNIDSIIDISYREFEMDIELFFDHNNQWSKRKKKDSSFYNCMAFYSWVYQKELESKPFSINDDIWILNKIGIKIMYGAKKCNALYFNTFKTEWVKSATKEVTFYKLASYKTETCKHFIESMRIFDDFVQKYGYKSPSDITRDITEEILIPYLRNLYPCGKTCNHIFQAINSLYDISTVKGLKGFNKRIIFLESDYSNVKEPDPKPYSDKEMGLIISHMHELSMIDQTILGVLILQGFRISDLLGATIQSPAHNEPALKKSNKNEWTLTYIQYKTSTISKMPLQEEAGKLLFDQIQHSKNKFGEKCVYIFATEVDKHVTPDTFRRHLKKMVASNNLLADDGKLLDIGKTHRFRKTLATNLINASHDPKIVSAYLGQKGLGSLDHYVKISIANQTKAMTDFHHENNLLINNMGNDTPNILENSTVPNFEMNNGNILPMSNGYCCKPDNDICSHANACLACKMFKPDRSYLPVYKMQLYEAQLALKFALQQGLDSIAAHNEKVIKNLTNIIQKMEVNYHG